jgi:predicted O-methyltransferase YrrM
MKWLFLNAKERIRFASRQPAYALRSLFREITLSDERFLAAATGVTIRDIRRFLDEPSETPGFLEHLHKNGGTFRATSISSADLYAKKVLLQYATVRALRPELVVETGVANGVSTSYLLLALRGNGKGMLHSIEVGDSSYLPPDCSPGWIVPDELRGRWTLHIGDARDLLPKLLWQLGKLDVFIHDSLHTDEHMRFEFAEAYPHLRDGGLLIADDALWNRAFLEFARQVGAPMAQILHGVGFLRK